MARNRSETTFEDPAAQQALDAARDRCISAWRSKVGNTHASGGHFCFGPIDGGCGICHEKIDYAIDCLGRFRVNKGGGYSDRQIYSGATGKPIDCEKRPAGNFSAHGRFKGAGDPSARGAA